MKFQDHLNEQLKDDDFRREYEKQEKFVPEYLAEMRKDIETADSGAVIPDEVSTTAKVYDIPD